jgi:large subunit ribosomal protein L6
MSRVGKSLITIPSGVKVDVNNNNLVSVKGPKGALTQKVDRDIKVVVEDGTVRLERPT